MAALAAPADMQIPEQAAIPAGPRKAAILLASLSEESIAAMLQRLSESEVRHVIRELSTL
jgi:flagellar motor switch protein FliG